MKKPTAAQCTTGRDRLSDLLEDLRRLDLERGHCLADIAEVLVITKAEIATAEALLAGKVLELPADPGLDGSFDPLKAARKQKVKYVAGGLVDPAPAAQARGPGGRFGGKREPTLTEAKASFAEPEELARPHGSNPRPSGAERRKRSRERADARTVGTAEPTADLVIEQHVLELDRAAEGEGSAEADRVLVWSSGDLDRALEHVLCSRGAVHWAALCADGATNDQIIAVLGRLWPRARQYFPPGQTEGNVGCTVQMAGGCPAFWIGAFKAPDHKATLYGSALISRIRAVLGIQTPSAVWAAKRGQKTATSFTGSDGGTVRTVPTSVPRPADGWDSASVANAAEDLGIPAERIAECDGCGACRASTTLKCPACGDLLWSRPDGWPGIGPPTAGRRRKAVPGEIVPE